MSTGLDDISPDRYADRLEYLDRVLRQCVAISQACADRPADRTRYYASVLFTSLCARTVSLAMLLPRSTWAAKPFEHWDFASVAGIVRSLLEVRLAFFHLGVEATSPDESLCRWNLFNLHDCISRKHLFEDLGRADEVRRFGEQAEELKTRLRLNPLFNSLPAKAQKKLLNGQHAYLSSLEDIAVRAGIELSTFRQFYRLFSVQVHGLPLSFYRMVEHNRGRGVRSEAEEGYTCLAMCPSQLVCSCARATR